MKVYEIALNEDVQCIENCISCSISGVCKKRRAFEDEKNQEFNQSKLRCLK